VDVALALLGRLNAQLQLLTLAFPAKMLTALLVLSWIAALFPRLLREAGGHAWVASHRMLDYEERWQTRAGRPSNLPSEGRRRPHGRAVRVRQGVRLRVAVSGIPGAAGGRWSTLVCPVPPDTRSLLLLAFTRELRPEDLIHVAYQIAQQHILPIVLAAMAVAVATVGLRLVTTRFGVSFKKLVPDGARFNPLARLKDLPKQNLPNLGQAMVLIPIFLWAVYVVARDKLNCCWRCRCKALESGMGFIASSLMDLFWKAAGVFVVFGCVDLLRQTRRHNQDLRMSKQEIREEMKEARGQPADQSQDPPLTARPRAQANDEASALATAVITNPTHFAVGHPVSASTTMGAPMVVAKGKNYLALRITGRKRSKTRCRSSRIRRWPQALYKYCRCGGRKFRRICIARWPRFLAYIFKLMNGKLPG